MVKNQNMLSLKQKDCDADGCFVLHQDERWMLYVFNLLLLQTILSMEMPNLSDGDVISA